MFGSCTHVVPSSNNECTPHEEFSHGRGMRSYHLHKFQDVVSLL